MRTSNKGIELIKKFEGIKTKAYKCPAGVWTIGYGHTKGVQKGDTCTMAQAIEFLKKDLETFEKYVNNLNLQLNQNQFDALVSFCYNCGPGNLKTLVRNRTLAQIADALPLYNKGGGIVLEGLVKRRAAERELFITPENITDNYKVIATALNVRSGPGTTYKIKKVLKKDVVIEITETNGNWGKLADGSGWVSMKYLSKT